MKIGRNAPCPCGSGKKYKKCCLNKEKPPVDLLWRRLGDAHDRLIEKSMAYANRSFGGLAMSLAVDEFMLWPEEEAPEDQIVDHMQLFVPWFVFNWMYDPEDMEIELAVPVHQTIAEMYAADCGQRLDSLQRRLIDATSGQPYSFLEVIDCKPGEGFRLKDILQGIETDVIEKQGSENARPGDILLARVVRIDHVAILVGCSSILIRPSWKPAIIELRRDIAQANHRITPDVLNDYDVEIRDLYFEIYESQFKPPQFCNTDGDPLLFHILHYDIDDAETAFQGLSDLSVVEDAQGLREGATLDAKGMVLKAEIPWTRKGYKASKALDNTILGRIIIDHRKMTIEVNSEARAHTIRQEIEARLRKLARYKTTEIQAPGALLAEAKNGDFEEQRGQDELMQIPEVREKMAKVVAAHWEEWIDQEIPVLGGKTPRQAVKTPDGRESVEALILEAERHMSDDENRGHIELAAIAGVRRRLGLGKTNVTKT
jgi:hypothetical protein